MRMWHLSTPTFGNFACLLILLGRITLATAEPPARDPALRVRFKHGNQLLALAFGPSTHCMLTLDCDAFLCLWSFKSGAEEYKMAAAEGIPGTECVNQSSYWSALCVSPDGRLAAACAVHKSISNIQIYDIRQKKKLHDIKPLDGFHKALALSFSIKGDRLACALGKWGALQWSIGDAKALTPTKTDAIPLTPRNPYGAGAITHLRGDKVMAASRGERKIGFYDAQSGGLLATFIIPTKPNLPDHINFAALQLALSSEGNLLLVVCRGPSPTNPVHPNNMITVWDMTTGESVWSFGSATSEVGQAAFSPDGRYIAVGLLNDPIVRVFRLSDSKEVATFHGHTKGVTCIAFSPDGTMIASGSLDHTAIVWNVKEGLLPAAERPRGEKEFAKCWDKLRDGKPLDAAEAVAAFAATKDDAVAWIEGKIKPASKPDAARVQKLFAQLDDDDAQKRDEASQELRTLGPPIAEEIKKALAGAPSPEVKRRLQELQGAWHPLWVRDPDTVRAVRSIYVLERVGSVRAVALLKKLAAGDPAARQTREAKISLDRLEVRKPPKP